MASEELRQEIKKVLGSDEFSMAPQRIALLTYLWDTRKTSSTAEDLWKGVLHEQSRSKNKDDEGYDSEESVRQSCLDLRQQLRKYSSRLGQGWHFDLPKAVPGIGWRLQFIKLNDGALSPTRLFWQAHLYPPSNVAVVYTEQLFYQNWAEHFVFRYYHLNAEDETKALTELKEQHPSHNHEGLFAAHPYISCGEVEARDAIVKWFDEHALVSVEKAVTRHRKDTHIAESSLILLRSPATNTMVEEILESSNAQHLSFSLLAREFVANERRCGQVTIKNPTPEEMQRLASYAPELRGTDCILEFSPNRKKVFAIVSRLRNPHGGAAVTILNSDVGRAVEQKMKLLTDDKRMAALLEQLKWSNPLPDSFEILFMIPIESSKTDHLRSDPKPLAWRSYANPS